jgi:hypothetical protein
MITIVYGMDGRAVSDFDISDWIWDVIHHCKEDYSLVVSNALPIHMVRLEIVKGNIDPKDITFKYFDQVFQANKYGAIPDWPKGFADREIAVCEDILRTAMKIRKKEREN